MRGIARELEESSHTLEGGRVDVADHGGGLVGIMRARDQYITGQRVDFGMVL